MNEEEIYKMLLTEKLDKFPLLNEIFAIRNNKFRISDYTIYVSGCISLDVINRAIEKVNYISKLEKENEHKDKIIEQMAEYIEDISKDTEVPVHKQAIIDFYYKKVEEENE